MVYLEKHGNNGVLGHNVIELHPTRQIPTELLHEKLFVLCVTSLSYYLEQRSRFWYFAIAFVLFVSRLLPSLIVNKHSYHDQLLY